VAAVELKRAGDLSYREIVPEHVKGAPVLLLHGFPESSLMWADVMAELGASGRRAIAPDLYCLGDSADPGPASYERNVEALEWLAEELGIERATVVVHDWGGFIGLTWACRNPERTEALVISDTGFFKDAKWHGIAELIRSHQGEDAVESFDKASFTALLRSDGAAFTDEEIDAYWRPFEEGRGREATLEFYRGMEFEELAPYDGKLAEMNVPTLLIWGARDTFAPLSGGRRFEREIPSARLEVFEDAGHFVFETERERCAELVADFIFDLP